MESYLAPKGRGEDWWVEKDQLYTWGLPGKQGEHAYDSVLFT